MSDIDKIQKLRRAIEHALFVEKAYLEDLRKDWGGDDNMEVAAVLFNIEFYEKTLKETE